MKRLFFASLLWVLLPVYCASQSIEYVYDSSGNRLLRRVIILAPSPSAGLQSESAVEETPPSAPEVIEGFTVKIYPNPTRGVLILEIQGGAGEHLALALYDSSGNRLFLGQVFRGQRKLDLSAYPSGWYILCIGEREYKIIKQ